MAAAKMVGFVVTPTTDLSLTRSARLPVSIRSRDRSSSQMDTPASASALRRSLSVLTASPSERRGTRTCSRSCLLGRGLDAVLGRLGDGVGREAELLEHPGRVSGRAVVLEADHPTGVADVLAPALADAGLDADAGLHGRREHLVAVGLRLLLEPLDRGHRHHAGVDALRPELLSGLDRELHLGAGADQDDVGLAALGVD